MGQECSCDCGDQKSELQYQEYRNIMQNNQIQNEKLQAELEGKNQLMNDNMLSATTKGEAMSPAPMGNI
jgi:hypothetical protein